MLRIFRQNSIGQVIVIIATAVLLWGRAFVQPVQATESSVFAPLYDLIYGWLTEVPRLACAVALLVVVGEGIWLNIMLYNHKLIPSNSLLPLYLYLLAMSGSVEQLTITPLLFVNLMILMAISQLLSDGSTTLEVEKNFNASFCIGLAALFYLPAVSYIIPFLFVFVIYKMYRWRHLLVAFFGIIAPSIILFTYAFMDDKLPYYLFLMHHDITSMTVAVGAAPVLQRIANTVFLLLLLAALLHQLGNLNDKMIHNRINMGILTLPLLSAAVMLLYSHLFPTDTQAAAFTFAFLMTCFLMAERKRKWIGESMLWILIAGVLSTTLI